MLDLGFKHGDLLAFAVSEIGRDRGMHADGDSAYFLAVTGQGEQPHDVDRHALGGLGDVGRAAAVRVIFIDRALEAGADALAGHFLIKPKGAHLEGPWLWRRRRA